MCPVRSVTYLSGRSALFLDGCAWTAHRDQQRGRTFSNGRPAQFEITEQTRVPSASASPSDHRQSSDSISELLTISRKWCSTTIESY